LKDLKPLAREEESFFPIDGKKKPAKKNSPQSRNEGKVQADEVLHFQAPPPRDRDNRRGGRGRSDRQRQGGNRGRGQAVTLTDADFPSLGGKA